MLETNRNDITNLLRLLASLVDGDETAPKDTVFCKWREEILDDPRAVDAALTYTFAFLWDAVERDRKKPAPVTRPPRATPVEVEKKVKAVREEIVRRVLALEFVMPNGLPLGDCTFGYLAKVGGVFTRMSTMGRSNQIVRKVVTEEALRRRAVALPS